MQLEGGGSRWGRQGQQSPKTQDQVLGGRRALHPSELLLGWESSGAGRPLTGRLFCSLPHLPAPGQLMLTSQSSPSFPSAAMMLAENQIHRPQLPTPKSWGT